MDVTKALHGNSALISSAYHYKFIRNKTILEQKL